MKNITKEKDPAKGLLAYRSTPLARKFSPTHFSADGKTDRNSVPAFHTQLNLHWPDLDKLHARENLSKLKQETIFNSRHRAKPLSPRGPDTEVFVKDL